MDKTGPSNTKEINTPEDIGLKEVEDIERPLFEEEEICETERNVEDPVREQSLVLVPVNVDSG